MFPLGTYTSIRGVVKVKGKHLKIAEEFSKNKLSEQETSFVKEHLKTLRSDSIPNNNELQRVFRYEESFFDNRVEKDILYFKSNLKNYIDHDTGLTPVESFFKNILENIAEEILLLEENSEDYMSVNQYSFSLEERPKIKKVNVTNYENEDYSSLIPPSEPQENDFFREFKKNNNLQIFKSAD